MPSDRLVDLSLDGRTVLAVFAHPDDESLACGGTLARLADAGAHVVLMSASHGERGGQAGPVRDDELGRTRAAELREAAQTLGAAEVVIWDHPDGDLQWAHVANFYADLLLFIRHHRPAAVITFGEDGLYWHRDHIGVHERTTSAIRALGADAPSLYYVTMARGVMSQIVAAARAKGWTPTVKGFWSLNPDAFGIAAEQPTIVTDVTAWVPKKLAGIFCHRSQVGEGHPFDQLDAAEAARLLGFEYFHRAAISTTGLPVLESLCTSRR